MSISRTVSISGTMAGLSIAGSITRSGQTEVNADVALDLGVAATLTTRTDDDTGAFTVAAAPPHGLTAGDKVDVYWPGGLRRGMVVGGGVTATGVPLDVGAGDVLPAAGSAVTLGKQKVVDLDFTGANVVLASARATRRCSADFQQAGGASVKSLDLGKSGNDNEAWEWHATGDVANPFGATVGQLVVSNGSAAVNNFRFGALLA